MAATNPSLESIFPRYKVYKLEEPMQLTASPGQSVLATKGTWPAQDMVCGIPRTTGRGFQRGQKWRYLSLMDATDQRGHHRGSPCWLLFNNAKPYPGSVFACLGLNDTVQLATPPVLDVVSKVAQRLHSGMLLVEAGTEHFSYWPQEKIRLGAKVANLGPVDVMPSIRVTVRDNEVNALLTETRQLKISSHQTADWQTELALTLKPKDLSRHNRTAHWQQRVGSDRARIRRSQHGTCSRWRVHLSPRKQFLSAR